MKNKAITILNAWNLLLTQSFAAITMSGCSLSYNFEIDPMKNSSIIKKCPIESHHETSTEWAHYNNYWNDESTINSIRIPDSTKYRWINVEHLTPPLVIEQQNPLQSNKNSCRAAIAEIDR